MNKIVIESAGKPVVAVVPYDYLMNLLEALEEAIEHLRSFGLNDEQIMQCLDLTLEEIQQIDLQE